MNVRRAPADHENRAAVTAGSTRTLAVTVAGETLAECLREGPLPLEQAFTVATEIAVALAVAHR